MDYTHLPAISCYYSDQPVPPHANAEAHFEYEMILVTNGNATLFVNHKNYQVKEKSLIFINRLERHSLVVTQKPYKRYVTTLSSDIVMSNVKDMELVSIFIQRPKNFEHVIQLSNASYEIVLPLFMQLEEEYTNQMPFCSSKSMACVVSLLIDLYRTHPECFPTRDSSNISTAVINAQKYVNDNFSHKITLQKIADLNYVSKHALSLAFKDIVGVPFKDYLILFRITESKKLLISTDLSIADIAEKVGYINVNNFIRIFKEKESKTPLQYRKQSDVLNLL